MQPEAHSTITASPMEDRLSEAARAPVRGLVRPGRLALRLGPGLDDGPDGQQGHNHDRLPAEDDPVDVDRRPPAQLALAEDVRPDRAGRHAEPAAGTLALALRILAAPGPGAALDPGRGDDGDAVLLVRLAEHPLDRHRVPRLCENL